MTQPTILCDLSPHRPDPRTLSLYARLDGRRRELDGLRPLAPDQAADLKRLYDLDLTYNSNAIEGSTLTYAETRVILEQGITVAGKPLREHLEVINHKEAIDFIEELAACGGGPMRESDLLSVHSLILRGIDPRNAGRYRTVPVLTPPRKQPIEFHPGHLDPGRAAMVALVGPLDPLHGAQQGIHLVERQAPVGAHRPVAGHGGQDPIDLLAHPRGLPVHRQVREQVPHQALQVRVAQQRRDLAHRKRPQVEAVDHQTQARQDLTVGLQQVRLARTDMQ